MIRKPDIDPGALHALLVEVFGNSVEADENLEVEAELHRRLRGLGVKMADVVHVDPFNAGIERSTLIATEVAGASLSEISDPATSAAIAEEAGADLAIISGIAVDGFGFVRRRDRRWPLAAEYQGDRLGHTPVAQHQPAGCCPGRHAA